MLATLCTKVIFQREKFMPHCLGHRRSLPWKRIFSAKLMGKTVLISCSEDILAPHLQQLSEVHNLEPSTRPQKKTEKGKTSQILCLTILTHQGSYSQFAVTFRAVELILSKQYGSILFGKPPLLPSACLRAVCSALPATHNARPGWRSWDDAPSHFDLWHLPE